MAIDPNIPLQAQAGKPIDVMGAVGRAQQIQGMAQQAQMRNEELRLRQADRAASEQQQQAIREAFPALVNGQMAPEEFVGRVGPEAGMKILTGLQAFKTLTEKGLTDAKQTAGQLADAFDTFPPDLQRQIWPSLRQAAKTGGLGDLPEQPTPEYIKAVKAWVHGPVQPKPTVVAPGSGVVDLNDLSKPPVVPVPKEDTRSAAFTEYRDYANEEVKAGRKPMSFSAYQDADANRKRPVTNISTGGTGADATPVAPPDPLSANILSQTGLSINAFRLLTGQSSQLARDKVTREKAAKEAETWARAHNVDISTLPAQYKAYNDVLATNIARLNNTKIMESELAGTVENLQSVIGNDFSKVKLANVWKVWAGEQVNDETAQQYAFHLGQLRNELAAYYAAAAGRPGSGITITDLQEAERTIKNGIGAGGLKGLADAVHNSTAKMGPIMQGSVDRSQKAVWGLFGVGQNYKDKGGTADKKNDPMGIR